VTIALRRIAGIAITLALCALVAAARPAPKPDTTMIVSTDWLAKNLSNRSVVVLVVDRTDTVYRAGHVPGARFIPYAAYGQTIDGIQLELPSPDSLRALFESAGISNATHVILTGRPLIVTRAFYTLTYLGLEHVSALDGGFTKWHHEGRAVETAVPDFARGHITPSPHPEIVAKAPWVLDKIGKPGYSFIDTRTEGEYLGTASRGNLQSTGHIDGARRLEWQDAFTDSTDFTPKSIAELSALWNERVTPGDTVITYCYIGYRASGSYFISRLLGYPAKLYDGSYDEWARLKYPTVTTVTPLRTP
jgi:thiosulfate/3-mercaptopyruvate sulfurtransferase